MNSKTLPNFGIRVKWWRRAADQGFAEAQFNLGVLYLEGGVRIPDGNSEALKWLRKAADQNLAEAEYTIGILFSTGKGVAKNDGESVKWFRKAAEQGYVQAQHNLGVSLAKGYGVPTDLVQGYVWLFVAKVNGLEAAKTSLTEIKNHMTPDQIAEATKLAKELQAKIKKK